MADTLLQLQAVSVHLKDAAILTDISFSVGRGEIVGLVGESGSGKSIMALTVMDLLPPGIHKSGGRILLDGQDADALSPKARRRMLGDDIAMIFQDPMTSLNPLYTIGHQLVEMVKIHHPKMSKRDARKLAAERLAEVEIDEPEASMQKYPHQFSGGQRQRICIAMALMNRPRLLIADEATTALDVTVQYHILELLRRLAEKHGMALIVISHNLALIAHICSRIMVLYTGRIVETGGIREVLEDTRHPYTADLLRAIPENAVKGEKIPTIRGRVPSLFEPKTRCPFYPRCRLAEPACLERPLERRYFSPTHYALCFRSDEVPTLRAELPKGLHRLADEGASSGATPAASADSSAVTGQGSKKEGHDDGTTR